MSVETRTGRLLLSGSIKNGDSHACLCRPAGEARNGGGHSGEPDCHLATGAVRLWDSQSHSPCTSDEEEGHWHRAGDGGGRDGGAEGGQGKRHLPLGEGAELKPQGPRSREHVQTQT